MARYRLLLLCVGQAVVAHGLKCLAGLVPFGDHLYDIACEACKRYHDACQMPEAVAQVEALAQASLDEAKTEANQVFEEVRTTSDPDVAAQLAQQDVQKALVGYLENVPSAVRSSLRRPADPTGRSVPHRFSFQTPEDFLRLLPPRPPRFHQGDLVVGNWQLHELLGVGGFGEVWKAQHPHLRNLPPVALKFCLDESSARYLRHEATIIDQLMGHSRRFPGIVELRHAYLDTDPPCLEYEFINGGNLCGILHQWQGMDQGKRTAQATRLIQRLAGILAPLHRLNPAIVHRDLKPANILMFRNDSGKYDLKIGDFGIGGVSSQQALTGASRGFSRGDLLSQSLRGSHTPLYASDEQMRGSDPNPRDDVHALGVIWFQMLVGDLDRRAGSDLDEELRDLGVADGIINLVKRCVARRERRVADAGELADRIISLTRGDTPKSSPVVSMAPPLISVPSPGQYGWPGQTGLTLRTSPGQSSSPPVVPSTVAMGVMASQLRGRQAGETVSIDLATRVSMTFAWIPPGTFLMGSPANESDRKNDETQHNVTLTKGFWLGIHQVTQAQWQEIMKANPKRVQKDDRCPVVHVSWGMCQKFVHTLGQRTEKQFRLPSEAEWEYACRAGTTTPYSFGETISTDQANYDGTSTYGHGKVGVSRQNTTRVGKFLANAWGLYDMHGNVWEWCQDWYSLYSGSITEDPQGPAKGELRVLRGGSWNSGPSECRSANRYGLGPGGRNGNCGCRVVLCLD